MLEVFKECLKRNIQRSPFIGGKYWIGERYFYQAKKNRKNKKTKKAKYPCNYNDWNKYEHKHNPEENTKITIPNPSSLT